MVPRSAPSASLLRRRDRDQHRDDIVAAIDNLAAFVRPDEAGVVCLEHGLLSAGDESELTSEHVIDFLRRRGIRTGAAARQKMRKSNRELLGAAGIEPKQTQRAVGAMVGRFVRLCVAQMLHLHQNFSPFSIRYAPL